MISYFRLISAPSRPNASSSNSTRKPERHLFPWSSGKARPAPRRSPDSPASLALIITSPRRMPWMG